MSSISQGRRSLISAPKILIAFLLFAVLALPGYAQEKLSVNWEELTGPDFIHAIAKAQGACLLPIGIIEKHGPQLPLGTDLIDVRYAALHAAEKEYAVVFPPYYFGQIFEARHQPGTVAYSAKMQMELLQETTDEMARNGCKKVIIVNGHGGNESLLPYFAQTQLAHGMITSSMFCLCPIWMFRDVRPRNPPSICTPEKRKPRACWSPGRTSCISIAPNHNPGRIRTA